MTVPRKTNINGGRPTKCPGVKILAELYANMTAREIAKKYSVKESTVRSWIARARKRGK